MGYEITPWRNKWERELTEKHKALREHGKVLMYFEHLGKETRCVRGIVLDKMQLGLVAPPITL